IRTVCDSKSSFVGTKSRFTYCYLPMGGFRQSLQFSNAVGSGPSAIYCRCRALVHGGALRLHLTKRLLELSATITNAIVERHPLTARVQGIGYQDDESKPSDPPRPEIWRRGGMKWVGLIVLVF